MKYTPKTKLPIDAPRMHVDFKIGDTVRIMMLRGGESSPNIGREGKLQRVNRDTVDIDLGPHASHSMYFRSSVVRTHFANGAREYGSAQIAGAQSVGDKASDNVYLKAYKLTATGLAEQPEWFVSTPRWIAPSGCDGWLTTDGVDMWYIADVYAYTATDIKCRRLYGVRGSSDLSASQRAIAHCSIEERRLYTSWFPKPVNTAVMGVMLPSGAGRADFSYREPPEAADLKLSPPIEIKTVDQINGTDFNRFTDDAIFDMLRDLEATWDHLSKIRAKPKALKNRMNEINATVDQLVALLDARTDATATK